LKVKRTETRSNAAGLLGPDRIDGGNEAHDQSANTMVWETSQHQTSQAQKDGGVDDALS
jgi:hypothetical protein